MLSSSHRLEPGLQTGLRLREREVRAEAAEDLHPASGASGGDPRRMPGIASAYMEAGIQRAGTAPTSTPRKPAAATPMTVMG